LFVPLLDAAQRAVNRRLGESDRTDIAIRRIADHGRAMTMLVADGVLPGNEGRGYVLRRLIRRAVLAARREGSTQPLTADLVAATIEKMGDAYPVLRRDRELIESVLAREEAGFSRTLRNGLVLLEDEAAAVVASGGTQINGSTAFRLHDTHGFPFELTEEVVAERGLTVDRLGFDVEMAVQRDRARSAAHKAVTADEVAYREILDRTGPSEFVGREREHYATESTVVAKLDTPDGTTEVFLDVTPFYAESGGQVGDRGVIQTETGRLEVIDTLSVAGGLICHRGRLVGEMHQGQTAVAEIAAERREAIRRNHTATHLLHAALRAVLGDHVRQQGSYVDGDRLRFDFSHGESLADEDREAVLVMANRDVLHNPEVETVQATRQDAEQMGAIAFFGDKYGDRVRVVRAGPHSLEFCGGTHVHRLGDIGQIQIVAESSIGANTRRLEAVSGLGSFERAWEMEHVLQRASGIAKAAPEDLASAVERLQSRIKEMEKSLGALRQSQLVQIANDLASEPGTSLVARIDGLTGDQLRQVAQDLLRRGREVVVVIGSSDDGKVGLVVASNGEIDATVFAKDLSPLVGGGAGGSSTLSQAGGRNAAGIDDALDAARRRLA
jgi:alanyl-tRNA synthetase